MNEERNEEMNNEMNKERKKRIILIILTEKEREKYNYLLKIFD